LVRKVSTAEQTRNIEKPRPVRILIDILDHFIKNKPCIPMVLIDHC
jgi:hypothetical protein